METAGTHYEAFLFCLKGIGYWSNTRVLRNCLGNYPINLFYEAVTANLFTFSYGDSTIANI